MAGGFGIIDLEPEGDIQSFSPPLVLVSNFRTFHDTQRDMLVSTMELMPNSTAKAPIDTLRRSNEKPNAQRTILKAKTSLTSIDVPKLVTVHVDIKDTDKMYIPFFEFSDKKKYLQLENQGKSIRDILQSSVKLQLIKNITPSDPHTGPVTFEYDIQSDHPNVKLIDKQRAKFSGFYTGPLLDEYHATALHAYLQEPVSISIREGIRSRIVELPVGFKMIMPLRKGKITFKDMIPTHWDNPPSSYNELPPPSGNGGLPTVEEPTAPKPSPVKPPSVKSLDLGVITTPSIQVPEMPVAPTTPVEPPLPEMPVAPTTPIVPEPVAEPVAAPALPEMPVAPTTPIVPVPVAGPVAAPALPEMPVAPTTPIVPEPVAAPALPEMPVAPTTPIVPEPVAEPVAAPALPEMPVAPTTPIVSEPVAEPVAAPALPEMSVAPTTPIVPEPVAAPALPEMPVAPTTPVEPQLPEMPVAPTEPVAAPVLAEAPGSLPETPKQSAQLEIAEPPEPLELAPSVQNILEAPAELPKEFNVRGTKVIKTRDDGWCFYRAVLKALEDSPKDDTRNADYHKPQSLASDISKWLKKNKDKYETQFNNTFSEEANKTLKYKHQINVDSIPRFMKFNEFINFLPESVEDYEGLPRMWPEVDMGVGDAAAELKHVNIAIYSKVPWAKGKYSLTGYFPAKDAKKTIYLYNVNGNHFDVLQPTIVEADIPTIQVGTVQPETFTNKIIEDISEFVDDTIETPVPSKTLFEKNEDLISILKPLGEENANGTFMVHLPIKTGDKEYTVPVKPESGKLINIKLAEPDVKMEFAIEIKPARAISKNPHVVVVAKKRKFRMPPNEILEPFVKVINE